MHERPSRVNWLPLIDEMNRRRSGWTPGRLFVGGDGRAWAMPVIDDDLIRSCPDLLLMLNDTNHKNMTSGGWVGEHVLANKVSADLLLIQYHLDADELIRVLAAERVEFAVSPPEVIAMMLSLGDGLKAGRIALSGIRDPLANGNTPAGRDPNSMGNHSGPNSPDE